MFSVVSRWKLKNGCPPELEAALEKLRTAVEDEEPGTLVYNISFLAPNPPIGPQPDYAVCDDMKVVAPGDQTELVFFEIYRDAEAFSDHLRGPAARFMAQNREFFATPWQGRPRPETIFLDPRHTFVRSALVETAAAAEYGAGASLEPAK